MGGLCGVGFVRSTGFDGGDFAGFLVLSIQMTFLCLLFALACRILSLSLAILSSSALTFSASCWDFRCDERVLV